MEHAGHLERHLQAVWHARHPLGPSGVSVINASFGSWAPTRECPTPRLWLFLVGHHRTFSTTRINLGAVANASSRGCYFVCVVVPDIIQPKRESISNWVPDSEKIRAHADSRTDLATMLDRAAAEDFGGRLAYAVVSRRGTIDTYEFALHFMWHAVWALSRWSARHHRIQPDLNSLVVRTRPDVRLRIAPDADSIRALFGKAHASGQGDHALSIGTMQHTHPMLHVGRLPGRLSNNVNARPAAFTDDRMPYPCYIPPLVTRGMHTCGR